MEAGEIAHPLAITPDRAGLLVASAFRFHVPDPGGRVLEVPPSIRRLATDARELLGQTVLESPRQHAILHPDQLASLELHRDAALGVLEEGVHRILAVDDPRVRAVEDREPNAVEADQPAVGREPEVAVGRLRDPRDRVLRQPFVHRIAADRVLVTQIQRSQGPDGPEATECEPDPGDHQQDGSHRIPNRLQRAARTRSRHTPA